jgi:hypothetical protein
MRAVRIHRNAVAAAAAPRRTTIQFRYQLVAENKRETLPARPTGLANNCTSAEKCVRSLADASSSKLCRPIINSAVPDTCLFASWIECVVAAAG